LFSLIGYEVVFVADLLLAATAAAAIMSELISNWEEFLVSAG